MNEAALQLWLKRKKSSGATARGLTAFMALLGGLLILFFTFWFTYAIIWFGVPGISAVTELAFSKKLKLTHEWRLIVSGGFLALLFIQHLRTSPWHWGDYAEANYVAAPGLQAVTGVSGSFASILAHPGASANMIADILLSGPRLVTGAWKLWRESRQLGAVDEDGCAQLLSFLASRAGAVSYEELREAGWESWFGQLRYIEGVVFLEKGISLSAELRQELGLLAAN
ncbi:MAG: hypothetical protein QM813_16380 [Verrucomicrobiota bacterium]